MDLTSRTGGRPSCCGRVVLPPPIESDHGLGKFSEELFRILRDALFRLVCGVFTPADR